MSKVIESGIPNQDERIGVTAEVNNIIGSKPMVVPFEVITNIPPFAKKITWHITKMLGGLEVVYRQDVVGPSMDTLKNRIINKGIIKDGKIVLKKKDGSSIFGSGFTTIGKYCTELVMTWEDEDGNPYNHDWLAEKDGTTIGELMEDGYKFQLSMFIKHTPKMGQYKKFVKKIITMISEYDAEPMLAGRTHEIFVGGFKQTADNTELSGVVTPWQPTWLEQNGSVRTTPEFTSLPDENGSMTNKIVVESVGADDKDGETSSIVLNIDSLGKIDSDNKLSEWIGDRPMVRIKYNGPNGQMAVLLPLRKGNGLTSLNNLLLDVWVDSKEIGYLYGENR